MGFSGLITGLLQQYAGGGAPAAPGAADDHFQQVAQAVDHGSLSSAIGSMMRSSETPAFGQMVGQLFQNGNGEQKASMLNTLLASGAPGVLSQLSSLIPGLSSGGSISPAQAQAIPAGAATQIAAQAEQHNPGVVDQMSSVFAAHPTLVKTLGAGAMIVALREIAKKIAPQG